MLKDNFDKLYISLVIVPLITIMLLLATNKTASNQQQGAGLGKAAEREMVYRARVELIGKIYGPVETLRSTGQSQQALLNLDELIRKYPAEAHGYIVKGEILHDMGVLDESIASFAQGIRLNGDYLDDKSPLSRRSLILRLVDDGQKSVATRLVASPTNKSLQRLKTENNYLKSRLAGGCE